MLIAVRELHGLQMAVEIQKSGRPFRVKQLMYKHRLKYCHPAVTVFYGSEQLRYRTRLLIEDAEKTKETSRRGKQLNRSVGQKIR